MDRAVPWARCEATLTVSCDSALLLVLSAFVNVSMLLLRDLREQNQPNPPIILFLAPRWAPVLLSMLPSGVPGGMKSR